MYNLEQMAIADDLSTGRTFHWDEFEPDSNRWLYHPEHTPRMVVRHDVMHTVSRCKLRDARTLDGLELTPGWAAFGMSF